MTTQPPSTETITGPLPPSIQLDDFLSVDEHAELLDWVLSNRARFEPATVVHGDTHHADDRTRIALRMGDVGPMKQCLREKLLAAVPRILGSIGGRLPDVPSLELELTAYGDGAFYRAHRDIQVGPARKSLGARPGEDRVLSAVYYFHRQPKGFSGGELRLFRWGASAGSTDPNDWRDIPPTDNSLACFATWAVHEVRAVTCPSGAFEDYRFALNCWYCANLS